MAISYSSLAASVPNWQLLQTATPSGVSTITFSGLAGYSRYRILAPNLIPSGDDTLGLRINADSSTKYNYGYLGLLAGVFGGDSGNTSRFATFYTDCAGVSGVSSRQFDIENALLLIPKFITSTSTSFNAGGNRNVVNGFGSYITTSAITSITLLYFSNNFSTGTIYLLGAN